MSKEKSADMAEKEPKRCISKKQKAEIVIALLRGESIEELSRHNKISVHEIAQWRDAFLESGANGLSKQSSKSTRESELERIIGRQQMEIELLKKKTTGQWKRHGTS